MMALSLQQRQQPPAKVEYFYVYVAELEFSTVGYWIQLEPDKSLSLAALRGKFPTCFGIKHKVVDPASGNVEVRYIRYHNGFFRFPSGLDLNNTRFVAYYYTDVDDVKAFMEMVDSIDDVGGGGGDSGEMSMVASKTPQLPPDGVGNEDSTLLGRTIDNFHMESVLRRGAQSTPVKESSNRQMPPVLENVSSTSDVILNEPPVEVITIRDTQSTLQLSCPPPPPGAPNSVREQPKPSTSTGIRAKLGPSVSSTSDGKRTKNVEWAKRERITINDSSGYQRERSSVLVPVNTIPKSRNMLDRYQQTRPAPGDMNTKTPLKVTFKNRGRQVQRNRKILKIEDGKGRTTALLTKKKWSDTAEPPHRGQKRRSESDDELDDRYEKRRRYDNHYQNQYQAPETKPLSHAYGNNDLLEVNVLLVGFHHQRPIVNETIKYFSDFGIVSSLHVSPQENRHNVIEYYAFMKIRTNDATSLFSDRHLYNMANIYAIRVDGARPPLKVTCNLCGYYGLNVAYLHYHVEGQCHQHNLTKRLEKRAAELGNRVYLDSYYRISSEELYVQYPVNNVQETVRHDYWKRCYQSATYSTGADARSDYRNYYSSADNRERYY